MQRAVFSAAAGVLLFGIGTGFWLDDRSSGALAQGFALPPGTHKVEPLQTIAPADREAVPAGELRYRRMLVESKGDISEACLVFSSALDDTGAVAYADYLKLPTGLHAAIRIKGARLCLSGLPFGGEHEVELLAGLPGAKGEKLKEPFQLSVGFGDRPSSISFGPGFVLPREAPDGLPVTTINVDRLDIKIFRVGDRMLARMDTGIFDQREAHSYREEDLAGDKGRQVWSGTMPVAGPRNEAVVSLFPLAETIGKSEPGVYAVIAANPDAARTETEHNVYAIKHKRAIQWVVHTDIGLTSFKGDDGLTMVVRSLATAKPVYGARLTLVAHNNDELAVTTTNQDGKAHFAPGQMRGTGGMAPVMVMAYVGGDFNVLDLRRPDFDISDHGIDGRAPAGPVDAFLYTERGIYRPGETVELAALLRDAQGDALKERQAVVKVMRPDGKEHRQYTISDRGGGAGHVSVPLPVSANRGTWEATAHIDPKGKPIGRVSFEVQDFVPQRLGLTIGERPKPIRPGDPLSIPVEARFLYGAPASALAAEAELMVEADPAPFPAHKGFRWGVEGDRFASTRVTLEAGETNAEGRTTVTGRLPSGITSSVPLRAAISIAVREPGGRSTGEHTFVPVKLQPVSLGVRPHFDGSVREGQEAGFDVIAVDETGQRIARSGVDYRLLRDNSTWQWFRAARTWQYERVVREIEVAAGKVDTSAELPAVVRQVVRWGGYRLVLTDAASGASTSIRFHGGWYGEATADRPDRLKVASDRSGYQPGETAWLHIDTEFEGEAELVIANEVVHETRSLHMPAGGTDISVNVKPEWGAGAYALVTFYRPFSEKLGHAPVRAVGAAWLGLDPARRTLDVAIGNPERIGPRGPIAVRVKVAGGKRPFLTLAAVDQGILQLTRFKTPSPAAHYLSKRRLGVGMRDDYGRLIRGLTGQSDDQGGDAAGGKGLDVVPTRTVALFSGIVAVDDTGTATIPLDIPDFQGELRLMAVAFDDTKVGSAEARMTVRDPLVAEVILPRFLAPGDKGRATVLLHNVDGTGGDYRVAVKARDAVDGGTAERTIALPTGGREIFTVPLDGRSPGIGGVELRVAGPNGFAVSRSWPIQVRPPQLPETRQSVDTMLPGTEAVLNASLLDGVMPATGAVAVSLSRWQGLDVAGLLRWLDRYPYGCLEQTVSRALPLLYFNDVALMAGALQDTKIDARVQEAVDNVSSMQTTEGNFNMWGQWSSEADPWLSVFALDFLSRAVDKQFDVPLATLERGRQWLASGAFHNSRSDVRAYAAAVLARQGKANAGDLRYVHDVTPPKSAMALAHLGAALDAVGERARAASAFGQARNALADRTALERTAASRTSDPFARAPVDAAVQALRNQLLPYGSHLRDVYAVAAVAAASGRAAMVPAVLEAGGALDAQVESTTTQEKAWMLLAAAEMGRNAGMVGAEVNGAAVGAGDPVSVPVSHDDLARGVHLRNSGDGPIFRIVSVEGVPSEPQPAAGTGVTVAKSLFNLAGQPVDPGAVRRNDRVVVLIEGTATERVDGDYAILDLLPAGWEIEGVLKPEQPGYAWLGKLSETQMRQARDDRYIASVHLPSHETDRRQPYSPLRRHEMKNYAFRVSYLVRAVTPGEFTLPAAVAEHMYAPRIKARTAMGGLVVSE